MELRCLGASGQLGYGIPEEALRRGLARQPHVIGADLGSSDPGPHTLGSGVDGRGATLVRRDLELLLAGGLAAGVPVLMGSAGVAGGTPHLEAVADIVQDLARTHGWRFRLALVDAEVSPAWVEGALAAGRVRPHGGAPPLELAEIRGAERIVAQMGVEPFVAALDDGADVVLAGRACDTAIFAAALLGAGADPAASYHMAKIVECASQCADPGGRDAILGTVTGNTFTVESMAAERACRPLGVAAHALYEEADPYRFVEPSGHVDTSASVYEALDDRVTRVTGSRWQPAEQPTLKLEGATREGFRTFCFGGVRDPILLGQLPVVVEQVRTRVTRVLSGTVDPGSYQLRFELYGHDAVLGPAERARFDGHEGAVLVDVVAETQELAHAVCASARQYLLHAFYRGILATTGNLAFPFSPSEFDAGAVYRFSVHHLVEVDDLAAPFRTTMVEVGA